MLVIREIRSQYIKFLNLVGSRFNMYLWSRNSYMPLDMQRIQ